MEKKIMVIGAHPDDAEIMAGGLIAKATLNGGEAMIVVMTDGSLGGNPEERWKEQVRAARELRANLEMFWLKDGSLSPEPAIISQLRLLIRDFSPDIVITHSPSDLHQDHKATHDIVVAAVARFKDVMVLLGESINKHGFVPNVYVDIGDTLEKKISALLQHRSQLERGSLDVETVKMLNALRGREIGVSYAEGFEAFRIRIEKVW